MGGVEEEDEFDQSTLYENLKELIKTLFVIFAKEKITLQISSVLRIFTERSKFILK